jgi:lipase (class 3)
LIKQLEPKLTGMRSSPDAYPLSPASLNSSAKNIILTGHSLGAAIAAILDARVVWWPHDYGYRDFRKRAGTPYVFAAPRYASFDTLLQLDNPFNCINDYDIIPRVPARVLGYSSSLAEFDLEGSPYLELEDPRQSMLSEWLRVLATGRLLKSHRMETYRRKIGNSIIRPKT